ncbi:MAG: MBL fold metallo-hydrolase [Candidatus Harrisonbacteria bacterium]|nr:MBL fold metallo-hydrolase [Candidatus Harrisonbacteria bacterium]
MIINWYGEGCFKIQTGGLTLLTDPFESSTGLTPARGKNEVVLRTLTPWPMEIEKSDESQYISGAGEYEIQSIEITGFPQQKESSEKFFKTAYKITAEDIKLGLLGHLSDELSAEAMQNLQGADIIFIPGGGKPFISQEKAAKLIKQLGPKIVMAAFFKVPGLKRTGPDWKSLAEEMGQKPEVSEKLTIRKKEVMEQKGTKLVVLKI